MWNATIIHYSLFLKLFKPSLKHIVFCIIIFVSYDNFVCFYVRQFMDKGGKQDDDLHIKSNINGVIANNYMR